MKATIIYLFLLFFGLSLFANEPMVKFYLNDGSTKQYNISDIDTIGLIKSQSYYVMKIFYQDTLIAYYPTEVITKILFELDTLKNPILNVYICGYPKTYSLSTIDSIYFYNDIYQPLTIGSQVWMLKNLNVDHYRNGDTIPEVIDLKEWDTLSRGAWCYYNNSDTLGKIYAKLFNWYAVSDKRGLAPKGWLIPSDSEWTILSEFLGGDNIAGSKLKEATTLHWLSPNDGATNASGFSALPGGWRYYVLGQFENIGSNGVWWSSSEYNATDASFKLMYYDHANGFHSSYYGKRYGSSVRCIKDK